MWKKAYIRNIESFGFHDVGLGVPHGTPYFGLVFSNFSRHQRGCLYFLAKIAILAIIYLIAFYFTS